MEPNEILAHLSSAPRPPGYAKALSETYQKVQHFLRRFNRNDEGHMARLKKHASAMEWLAKDMHKANREATNPKLKPAVFVPFGVMEEILGDDPGEKPPDGEHWPENRPDGPMTWKK